MTYRTDRRAALKLLTATPLGVAMGAAFAHEAIAQTPRGTFGARVQTGPIEPGAGSWKTWLLQSGSDLRLSPPPDSAAEVGEVRAMAAQRDAARDRITFWDAGSAPYRWNEQTIELSHIKGNLPGGFGGRAMALVNVAIYDAIIAAWDSKYAHNRPRPFQVDSSLSTAIPTPMSPSYPCEHATVAGAASAVLAYLFPAEAGALEAMAQEAAQSRVIAGVQYPSDARAGLELGRAVGARVVEYGRSDRSDAKWEGTIPTGPGIWNGTNPQGVAESLWKPWVLSSAEQFRLPPPPAHDSEQRAAEVAEVKNFPRTPQTNGLAYMWQYGVYGGPSPHVYWNRHVSQKIFEKRQDDNAPWAARAYSLMAVGFMDAYIASQDSKFTYWVARPNMFDPSITTLFPTPPHPSYPSNATIFNGTTAAILGYLFPTDAALFQGLADQAAESRIWAGIHFRSDITGGKEVAQSVANAVIARIT